MIPPASTDAFEDKSDVNFIPCQERGADFARFVAVRISAGTIEARVSGTWIEFLAWLRSLPVHPMGTPSDNVGDNGFARQGKWWRRNGRSFPIMDLPLELGQKLLLDILGPDIYPGPWKYLQMVSESLSKDSIDTVHDR